MSDTKISEAAVEAAAMVVAGSRAEWFGYTPDVKDGLKEIQRAALEAALPHLHPQPAELSFDVEAMLTACVPGGNIVDPQVVADNIRAWVAERKPAELAEQQGVMLGAVVEAMCYDERGVQIANVSPVVRERIRRALAATGKQQVGEVQGDSILRAAVAPPRRFDPVAAEVELSAIAARQPVAQVPEVEFQCRLMDVKTDLPTENWHHSPTYEENPGRGTHYWVQYRKRYIYYTQPAQGIDLGPFREIVEFCLFELECRRSSSLPVFRKVWIKKCNSMRNLLELIDGQRDAAPGVGNG